jgi:ribosomal protein S18 acetylase RimI-like enzyme
VSSRRAPDAPRIRVASPADEQAVGRLRRQAEEVHARLLPDYFRVPPQVAAAPPPSPLGPPAVLVAEQGGEVIGYVAVRLVETPRDPAITPERRAHVETVVVDEGRRRQGVGAALMQAAEDWGARRGAAELVLTVWSDNGAAEALYRRCGYASIARILRKRL